MQTWRRNVGRFRRTFTGRVGELNTFSREDSRGIPLRLTGICGGYETTNPPEASEDPIDELEAEEVGVSLSQFL